MARPGALRSHLLSLRGPVGAVLDGAQFDNLPGELLRADVTGRPLYLDRGPGGRDRIVTAPHLIDLDSTVGGREAALDAVLHLLDDRPAAVFWCCGEGPEALFRHLRGINMVYVPGAQGDSATDASTKGTEGARDFVTFRHADANVLAQVLPSLDEAAFARLLGPADEIAFAPDPDWAEGQETLRAVRLEDLPAPRPGPLLLDRATLERIDGRRLDRAEARTADYLRRVLPEPLSEVSGEEMREHVRHSRRSAAELGIQGEAGHKRWAYLMAVTGGRVEHEPQARAFVARGSASPDVQVRRLIDEAASALREGRTVPPVSR